MIVLCNDLAKSSRPVGNLLAGLDTAPVQVPAPAWPRAAPQDYRATSPQLWRTFHNINSAMVRCGITLRQLQLAAARSCRDLVHTVDLAAVQALQSG